MLSLGRRHLLRRVILACTLSDPSRVKALGGVCDRPTTVHSRSRLYSLRSFVILVVE